jgi:hypothetical protein
VQVVISTFIYVSVYLMAAYTSSTSAEEFGMKLSPSGWELKVREREQEKTHRSKFEDLESLPDESMRAFVQERKREWHSLRTSA